MAREYRVVVEFSDGSTAVVYHSVPAPRVRAANEPVTDAQRRARCVGVLREVACHGGGAVSRLGGAVPVRGRMESREVGSTEWERDMPTRGEFMGSA